MNSKDCLVIIPSKGRPSNIEKFTIPFMSRLGLDYRIFVEPQDMEAYSCYENLICIEKNNQGLGYSLSKAKDYAKEKGYKVIFKIDDDVRGIGEVEKDIKKMLKVLSKPKISAIGFPYKFEWYEENKSLFSRINKRLQTCYLIKTEDFKPSENVSTFEDFYEFLLLRNSGKNTIHCPRHKIDCVSVGTGKGGLQEFDRKEAAVMEIEIFKKIDPTITVKIKENKPWYFEPVFNDPKYKSQPL